MAASIADFQVAAMYFGAPAILLSGWVLLGHLVTLDNDMAGGWSSPDASRKVWFLSLGELA